MVRPKNGTNQFVSIIPLIGIVGAPISLIFDILVRVTAHQNLNVLMVLVELRLSEYVALIIITITVSQVVKSELHFTVNCSVLDIFGTP